MSCTLSATGLAVARLSLAVLMGVAGLSKFLSASLREDLREAVDALGIRSSAIVVVVVATLETLIAAALLWGVYVSLAAAALVCLLTFFSIALVILKRRAFSGGCGCFFSTTHALSWRGVLRNLFLLGIALTIAIEPSSDKCAAALLQVSEGLLWSIAGGLIVFAVVFLMFVPLVRQIMTPSLSKQRRV